MLDMYWFEPKKIQKYASKLSVGEIQGRVNELDRANRSKGYYGNRGKINKAHIDLVRKAMAKQTPKQFSDLTEDEVWDLYEQFLSELLHEAKRQADEFSEKNLKHLVYFRESVVERIQMFYPNYNMTRSILKDRILTNEEFEKDVQIRLIEFSFMGNHRNEFIDVRNGLVCSLYGTYLNQIAARTSIKERVDILRNQADFLSRVIVGAYEDLIQYLVLNQWDEQVARSTFKLPKDLD